MRISDWSSDVCSSDLAAFRSIATLSAPGTLERIRTPLLLALAGRERVVSNAAIATAARRLPDARLVRFGAAKPENLPARPTRDRVQEGKRVARRLDLGGRTYIKNKIKQ